MSEQHLLEAPGRAEGRNFTVVSRAPAAEPGLPLRESEPEREAFARQDGGAARASKNADKKKTGRRGQLLAGVAAVVVLTCAGYLYWDNVRRFQSTDDAFIAARQFSIAPKVAGFITGVLVTDNQHVVAGQALARLDDRDYRVALKQAEAQVEAAKANVQNIDAQIAMQQAQVDVGAAQVEQVQATLNFAGQQAKRYEDLAARGSGSMQNAQQYASTLLQQDAALKSAQGSFAAAQDQVKALKAQRANADAALSQAEAQTQQAALNEFYTTITAAQSGRVVDLSGAVGQYATAGSGLAMFVPDDIWVKANFKETQLDKMRPGQPVTISIDAYPSRALRGHVESVQPGSGTAFSLLPAENATGNYVKIVQRVPVKIKIDGASTDLPLGPGMSVVPTVRVDPTPSHYELLRRLL